MSLYDNANIQEVLNTGVYAPLTGISKPMVEAVQNVELTPVSQVQTLVWSGAIVVSNVVNGSVGGKAIAPVTYATSNAATLTALAAAIVAANSDVLSAVSDGTDTITVTTKAGVAETNLADFVITGGAGQVTATITETVAAIPFASLEAGTGIVVNAATGVATLATDNATHVVVGSDLGLTDLTYVVAGQLKPVPAVLLGQALVDVQTRSDATIAKGDSVSFVAGRLAAVSGGESQTFVAEASEAEVTRIKFK